MTLYNFELLFPEDMPRDIQESIEKTIETLPRPVLFKEDIRLHEAKLRYVPVIEFSAIYGVPARKKKKEVYDYLSNRVEVKRGRSQFEIFGKKGVLDDVEFNDYVRKLRDELGSDTGWLEVLYGFEEG